MSVKPHDPSYRGNQYDENKQFIRTSFNRNAELPTSDPEMHEGYETPGKGAFNWSAEHYNNDFRGGYGVKVDDDGQNPKVSHVDSNVAKAGRGGE